MVTVHHRLVQTILVWMIIALKILIIIGLVYLGVIYFSRNEKSGENIPVTIEIIKGEGVRQIADKFKSAGLINSRGVFILEYIKKRQPLQSGIYLFNKNDSLNEIYGKISSGKVDEEKITIIEGWRREQIAQLLNQRKIIGYEEFMALSEGKEGRLFPDTYQIAKKTTAQEIVSKITENFQLKTKDLNPSQEQLIVASIVEREAKKDEDRALIASVFYNRLSSKMPLEADPTVQYAIDNEKLEILSAQNIDSFEFWPKLEKGQVKTILSPYNTYRRSSLPPAPISNPGQKSLKAAVSPAQSNFLYFISDKEGQAHFAQTKAEHDQNISQFLTP